MAFLSSTVDVIIILLGFGMLIFVHEMGHFLAAKWAGIRTEAFAVGMGPVVVSWRKGLGLTLGSTDRRVVKATGHHAHELSEADLEKHGLGETEYSLRWVPIGGFVKMLGQEDANPSAVSSDPRSYGQRPIGKRMVVVSAGVIMNLLLAAVMFVFAFMVGVPLMAPVIGDVRASMPAAEAVALNAETLGVTEPGIQPGDRVLAIDGKQTKTFADVQIASAMSRPGTPLSLSIERGGVLEPLQFSILPEKDALTQLLSIGVVPASSTTLLAGDNADAVTEMLEATHLESVTPGMRLIEAEGAAIGTYEEFRRIAARSDGNPVSTAWTAVDDDGVAVGSPVAAVVPVEPEYMSMYYAGDGDQETEDQELGLIGLTPLVEILEVTDDSPNEGVIMAGDVILRVGSVDGPRIHQFRDTIAAVGSGPLEIRVLRDGAPVQLTATVKKKLIGVAPGYAWDIPQIATPMPTMRPAGGNAGQPTPVAGLDLLPRTRIDSVNGTPVDGWPALRAALRTHTAAAAAAGKSATVPVTFTYATPDADSETLDVPLTVDDVQALHALAWTTPVPASYFEPIETIRSANGNPMTALAMGVEETHKHVLLTYITLDRLLRRSVGVKQIRGPLGIVHMGSTLLDRGFIYLVFLLAMISVNLAVINFLPLPIVDGGLFLFLIYEKIKGQPPSLAFQNAATIAGLFLIGTVFIVVTFNDVLRILS